MDLKCVCTASTSLPTREVIHPGNRALVRVCVCVCCFVVVQPRLILCPCGPSGVELLLGYAPGQELAKDVICVYLQPLGCEHMLPFRLLPAESDLSEYFRKQAALQLGT